MASAHSFTDPLRRKSLHISRPPSPWMPAPDVNDEHKDSMDTLKQDTPTGSPTSPPLLSPVTSGAPSLPVPNVYVIPPEEDQAETPPYCCFDADKDTKEDPADGILRKGDQDYATAIQRLRSKASEVGSPDPSIDDGMSTEPILYMHGLIEETSSLEERLRKLEISITATVGTTEPPAPPIQKPLPPIVEQPKKVKNIAVSALKTIGLRRGKKAAAAGTQDGSRSAEEQDSDKAYAETESLDRSSTPFPRQRSNMFSRRFKKLQKGSSSRASSSEREDNLIGRNTIDGSSARRYSTHSSIASSERKRFSIFEIHRRLSFSSVATTSTDNRSMISYTPSSKLSMSTCDSDEFLSVNNDPSSPEFLTVTPTAVTPPSTETSFALDSLQFETLQFNSEEFF